MGHKAVFVLDIDHINEIDAINAAEFVRRLKLAALGHRHRGGSVSINGATVANVVWSGHADLSPVLKIVDFEAENMTYQVRDLEETVAETADRVLAESKKLLARGEKLAAIRTYREFHRCTFKEALTVLGLETKD